MKFGVQICPYERSHLGIILDPEVHLGPLQGGPKKSRFPGTYELPEGISQSFIVQSRPSWAQNDRLLLGNNFSLMIESYIFNSLQVIHKLRIKSENSVG